MSEENKPNGADGEQERKAQPEEEPKAAERRESGEGAPAGEQAAGEGGAAGGEGGEAAAVDPEREAKLKAAAEARAARAAAKAAAGEGGADADAEKEAKRKAAAEARAARAAAKAAEAEPAEPKPPSPKQPLLDEAAELIRAHVHADAIEEALINELNGDMPTLVVRSEHWLEAARLLKSHERLGCNYLRNVSGVDYETHLETVYHLISLDSKREYAVKVKADRERPSIPSVTGVWPTANWNEREIYDLLGVDFPGHPDLRRIMMPDDWVGHPLRKDYVPLDPEV